MICRKFNIPWDQYGSLTVGQRDDLIEMLLEEHKEMERSTKSGARGDRAGMERVV